MSRVALPPGADGHSLSILVPTLNEEGAVGTVLRGLLRERAVDEILVVDGRSTDATVRIAEDLGVRVLIQEGRGLGVGLRQGFDAVGGDLIGIVDADGSHDWTALGTMRRLLLEEDWDYVLGSRYIGPFRWRGLGRWPFSTSEDDTLLHEWGNLGIVALAWALHGYPLHDVMMGMQIWRREWLDRIDLGEPGQSFDCEIKIQLHRAGARMAEISVVEPPRLAGEAKLDALTDGAETARVLLREWARGGFRRVKRSR